MPKVSVIIPIYNVAAYLDTCVASVCAQSFRDIEIILVDDGSTDACPGLCDEWAKKDPRITVIHKPNGGLSDARNAGLDAATGEYIQFVDADDFVEEELLSTVVPHMDQGCDLVTFRYNYSTFLNNDPEWVCNCAVLDLRLSSKQDTLNFLFSVLLRCVIGWNAWIGLYRKSIIDQNGLRFVDNKKIFAEDLCFCVCYCMSAGRIKSLPFVLYNYRKRGDSIMSLAQNTANLNKMNELGKEVLSYAEKLGFTELVACYPAIHFFIMNNAIERMIFKEHVALQEIRQAVRSVEDFAFFKKNARRLRQHNRLLCSLFNDYRQACEWISIYRYLAGGSFRMHRGRIRFLYRVINSIRIRIPFLLDRYNKSLTDFKEWQYDRFAQNAKRIYVLGTEDFGNIGDHAIAENIVRFLLSRHPDHSVFEVCVSEFRMERERLRRYIKDEDWIVMTGGGNFGNLYPITQKIRQDLVESYPNNRKIVFPQTVLYTDTDEGREALERDRQVFSAGNNVTLFCREKPSFDFAKANFTCKIGYTPDIVLYFGEKTFAVRREGVLLCLRSDKEKALTSEDEIRLTDRLEKEGCSIGRIDLQLDHDISKYVRPSAIHSKIHSFSTAKLVITDRLHGMIVSAVTGTPCIALSNTNHKIESSFEWLRELGYVRFVRSIDEAAALIPEMLKLENCRYDPDLIRPFFKPLEDELAD